MFGAGDNTSVPRKKATKKAMVKSVSGRAQIREVQTTSRVKRISRVEPEPKMEAAKPKPVSKRRAPTPIAATRASKQEKNKQYLVVFILMVSGIGASAAVGFLDSGQIDTNKAIEERNQRIASNQANDFDVQFSAETVPVQDTTKVGKADGGLKGLGVGTKAATPPPPPVTSSSTATSSEATASSSEATATSTEMINEDSADTAEDEEIVA